MIIVKYIGIFLILVISSIIGILCSKKYSYRVKDLEEMKNALNIFESKIKYTYEPIPEVFKEIGNITKYNIARIFTLASNYMLDENASIAWEKAIEEEKKNTNFKDEDIAILSNLSKMLGESDLDGQISSIQLTSRFLDNQINEAQIEKAKNERLYKTLGIGIGLTIVIVLI